MNRFQRALWLVVVAVTLVAFGLVIPLLPSLGPVTRHLEADHTTQLAMASVTLPAGWDVNIASASQSQPVASLGGVQIAITDAVWLGKSSQLVTHAAGLVYSQPPVLPDVPPKADGAGGEKWQILPGPNAPTSDPRRVIVLRRDKSVVLVIVRGPAVDVAAASVAIDSVVASVAFEGFTANVGAAS
ncbi:hypothetical protein [Demequina lutea]|uniref:hypothetical protein n=1 Tax=Demequina lutea TaxID=431489 RepID=UPI0015CB50C1|nr:hypothetical protein [Demequina lutea]